MVTYFDNQSGLRVGSMFHKRFYIERVLSDSGGFGITYLVRDQEMFNEPRVLKQLRMSGVQNPKAVELFEREARTLSQLAHPNIPRLHAFFHDFSSYYLVEDFIEGKSLREILQQQGPCSSSFVKEILNQMLDVLLYIHSQSMVHRDIKPDNLVWSFEGKVYLIDFGAVNEAIRSNRTEATVIFTQGYAAPEQIKGHVYPESDIYALGVTLLEMLTEKNPVDLYDPRQEKWVWQKFVDDIDERLAMILNKMTQEQLNQRFRSAQEIRNYLQGSGPVPAPKSTPNGTQLNVGGQGPTPQRERLQLNGPASGVSVLEWYSKSNLLGAIAPDQNALRLWRIPEARELPAIPLKSAPIALSWSPDPQRMAISTSQSELVWLKVGDPKTPTMRLTEPSPLIKWSPDGSYLATIRQGSVIIYDTRTGQTQFTFYESAQGRVTAMEWRNDSQFLALGTEQGDINLWEVFTEQRTANWKGHTAAVCLLQWDQDGQSLCTVSIDGQVRFWPAYSQQPKFAFQVPNRIQTAHWTVQGSLLACAAPGGQEIQLWHVPSKTHRESLLNEQEITLLRWSPDGKYLAAAGKGPVINLWKNF